MRVFSQMRKLRRQLEKVYDEHGRQLFTCALGITRNVELAEDAIHEAFCRGFGLNHMPQNLKAYMFSSVRNAAIDELRRRSRTSREPADFVFDSSPGPAEMAQQKQWRQSVAKALLELSQDERETIVQHLYADLTFQEIADVRGRPLGTVASWYRRGLVKLKEQLES